MATCECLVEPPVFHLPPPPDASLIWHLISEEPYEAPADCEWSPFISISDVSSKIPLTPLSSRSLIFISLIALLILLSLCTLVVCRIKRGRARRAKTKSTSSDGILAAGDNLWTYNSMKNSCSGSAGVLVYNGISHNAAYQQTPGTIRSFPQAPSEHAPVRPCTAATLRLHPKENSAAYHTVGRYATSPTEFYEEISNEGYYPYNTKCRSVANIHPSASFTNGGCRRPPPTCRPPPVPAANTSHEYSPNGSEEGSIDRELARIPADSPPLPRWEESERRSGEGGRESGYGTAPSRQWKSPPGRSDDGNRLPGYVLSQAPNVHSMTYV
ncbi:unnamed protein product [Cylicocyclus nassatus]|uniref:Uncharacterized protein n=1 Tax=Cylicocyclus nassatus TaxID=53992 RepID=A0AA36GJD1_CYLNA|nr:unnamed protein product [Cylicocyclus nassatus]